MIINPHTGFSVDRTPSETTDYDYNKYHDVNVGVRYTKKTDFKNYEQRIYNKQKPPKL